MKLQTPVLAAFAACFLPHAMAASTPDMRGVITQPTLILERGGERRPSELVEAFLQRRSSSEAFFREISGK